MSPCSSSCQPASKRSVAGLPPAAPAADLLPAAGAPRLVVEARVAPPRSAPAARHAGPVVPDCTVGNAGEHLHRMCQCGYFWIERCADAGEPQEIEVERVTLGVGTDSGPRAPSTTSQPAPVARGGAE